MHTNEITLEKAGDSEWLFKPSNNQIKLIDKLNKAEELMDEHDFDSALAILESVLKKAPECIEAYNDIYLYYLYKDQYDNAFKHLKSAVNNILDALPETFLLNPEQKLFWGFLENRPFLRLYVNLANEYLNRGSVKKAQSMYENVLQWNPGDNQGVRERVLICYFEQGLLDKVINVCDMYPDDMIAGLVYAKPLVFFIRKQLDKAKQTLLLANEKLPNVARELMKSRHTTPKSMNPGYITLGGDDEAYTYWLDFGKYWKRAAGAIAFVKLIITI